MKLRQRAAIVLACLALQLAGSGRDARGQGQTAGRQKVEGAAAQGRGRASAAKAQKPGQDRGEGKARKPGQGRGEAGAPAAGKSRAGGMPADAARPFVAGAAVRARGGRAAAREALGGLPGRFRQLEGSNRRSDHLVLGAAALAAVHGLEPGQLDLRRGEDRVELRNRRGEVLLELGERRARELGSWELRLLGDRPPTADAPPFCRSGAGHPVWGREWCLDRGYGLGRTGGRLWSRTTLVTDVAFREPMGRERYDRAGLIEVLGDVVFNRLALHALSLAFDAPLTGRWVAEPQAPRLLLIDAGPEPVAELVDLDGDDRVDMLFVTQSTRY